MNVFLVDGTYELFRHFFAVPKVSDVNGKEVGAIRGVVGSMLSLLENDVTHIGVATDHVVESFRNELWAGYKTGHAVDPELFQQFHPLEEALQALGLVVWPENQFEADDALASAAAQSAGDHRVEQVFVCTPDKDLAQCVDGRRIVQFDRRAATVRDAEGVRSKFGVIPESIPDFLALTGDTADGFPGIRGWGAKSASTVLARYVHLDAIPSNSADWDVSVRGADRLARNLVDAREDANIFLDLATLRTTLPVFDSVDELKWTGPEASFFDICARMNASGYFRRAQAVAQKIL